MDEILDPQQNTQIGYQLENRRLLEMIHEQNAILSDIREQLRKVQAIQVKSQRSISHVNVTDVQMKFGSMIEFILKWIFACIPAGLVLGLIWLGILLLLTAIGAGIEGIFDAF